MSTSPEIAARLTQQLGQAIQLHQQGQLAPALQLYQSILATQPDHFDALHLSGVIALQQGRHAEALALIEKALATRTEPVALMNRGLVLEGLGRLAEAIDSHTRALDIRPAFPDALSHRARALIQLGRAGEALDNCQSALSLQPTHANALNNLGNALVVLQRSDEALNAYARALAAQPQFPEAHKNAGDLLASLGRLEEAVAHYHHALSFRPDYVEAWLSGGAALLKLNRAAEALTCFDRVLALRPGLPEALNNRGNALVILKRLDEAIEAFTRAIAARPTLASAWINRAEARMLLAQPDEALGDYDKGFELDPQHPYAFGGRLLAALQACDWGRMTELSTKISAQLANPRAILQPYTLLGYNCSPAEQLDAASTYFAREYPHRPPPLWRGERYNHDRIRIAYLSADLRQHAVAMLVAGMLEHHDRSRFEITAISFGPDDGSPLRRRIEIAVDQFDDVRSTSDASIARLIRQREIDIAVDLGGYTHDARPMILANRPAPVQVNYLGYPSTMGADFIDYILADRTVVPLGFENCYSESVVHLPHCYQSNDRQRVISGHPLLRSELGLPDTGFVFCAFNNTWKITPDMFDVWMGLLRDTPNSVLWLIEGNQAAVENLTREAEARGVAASRLVFAKKLPVDQHLARHRLADLFLDTLPYNAHTTASDALWAGLPVVTCQGERFQSRVAASLLRTIGLPELVTTSLTQYEALIRRLIAEPALLKSYRNRLAANRTTSPLFDTPLFTRNIEAAYERMHDLARRGHSPEPFAIETDP